jgi:uncharacterized protein with HEPN domain
MKSPDETVFIRHMIDAADRIQEFLRKVDQATFAQDALVQSAVVYQIQIIGEAARRLSPEVRQRYRWIPWRDVTGMRNKLVHDYVSISIPAVWETATRDVPALRTDLVNILNDLTGA